MKIRQNKIKHQKERGYIMTTLSTYYGVKQEEYFDKIYGEITPEGFFKVVKNDRFFRSFKRLIEVKTDKKKYKVEEKTTCRNLFKENSLIGAIYKKI